MAGPILTLTFTSSYYGPQDPRDITGALGQVLRASLQSIGNHLAERATQAAPIRTGALRADIHAEPVGQANSGFVQQSGSGLSVTVGTNIPYARVIHQHQIKGSGPIFYGLGPGSAAADAAGNASEAGGVGGGWLIRTANYWADKYLLKLREDIQKHLGEALAGRTVKITVSKI
jgi:hypothetical protein